MTVLLEAFDAVAEQGKGPKLALAVCAVLGGFALLRFALKLGAGLYASLLRPGKDIRKTYGEWAVVTGATDGIGEAMAMELASRGCSVLLVSRTEAKLQATREAIMAQHGSKGIDVECLQLDFATFGTPDSVGRVHSALQGRDVGVLVNNVGMSYEHPKYYEELGTDEVQNLINLNVASVAHMTHAVLAGMKERRRGAIVNISSVASQFDNPLLVGYSGTKAYGEMFSRSLQAELAYCKGDFSVQCQVPFFVVSKLSKIRKSSLFTPTPAAFARASVNAIGYETHCCPYPPHKLELYALKEALPSWATRFIVQKTHADLRTRAIRKKEKAKAN